MATATIQRSASHEETAQEMDRRGAVIESLEAEICRLKKPFNTYPEDREKMLELCRVVLKPSSDFETFERTAVELADLVAAILTDEAA
jgi:hypothetical protein